MDGVGLVTIACFLVLGGAWLWALVDIATRPQWVYKAAGESKGLWFVVVLVLQFFGTIGYLAMARPELRRVERGGPAGPGLPASKEQDLPTESS